MMVEIVSPGSYQDFWVLYLAFLICLPFTALYSEL